MQQLATQFQPHDHAVQFYADYTLLAAYLRPDVDERQLSTPHRTAGVWRYE